MNQNKFSNHFYYIILTGRKGKNIFADECDKSQFLNIVQRIYTKSIYKVCSYCILDNDVHLLMISKDPKSANKISLLIEEYSQYYKETHDDKIVILKKHDMKKIISPVEKCIEIHMLPVKTGITERVQDYWWSSFGTYYRKNMKKHIDPEDILNLISDKKREAKKKFMEMHKFAIPDKEV
ncbi:MAG TPA: hypothetical protein IAC41_09425 [Candidatus Merdenecus merdavium]|nr:hypothetical protein [Candidatus Merdenecus merdavium]